MMRILASVVSTLALCTVALAQPKTEGKPAPAPGKSDSAPPKAGAMPAGPPAPAPEFLAATKFFLGTWNCSGMQVAGPWGPEAKTSGKLGFKMELGNFFMTVEGTMKMGANKMMFKGINGYDPAGKKFLRSDFDSMGSAMQLSSNGWEGDTFVFSGDGMMMGQKMKVRHTMTKKGETEFASVFEHAGADGKFAKMGEDSCKKGAGK